MNAVLTLDALVGILHAYEFRREHGPAATMRGDEERKNALARDYPAFKVVHDTAAALKHGELRPSATRMLLRPGNMVSVANTLGTFSVDDELEGDLVVFEIAGEETTPRADEIIVGALRTIERLVPALPQDATE